jgi:hypothetical protein
MGYKWWVLECNLETICKRKVWRRADAQKVLLAKVKDQNVHFF